MWINLEFGGYTHTLPLEDTKEHEVGSRGCWCDPEIDDEFKLVVHTSDDGREKFETGERKPS